MKKELIPELLKNSSELFFLLNDLSGMHKPSVNIATPKNIEQYSPVIFNPLVKFFSFR
jgi:hypothetical protein